VKGKFIAIPQIGGRIIVTGDPHNVGDPVSSGMISIKSME
jgi:hypothetical protein